MPTDTRSAGAIHDIGYRRYDGERLGRRQVVASLYLDGIRAAFGLGRATRSKVAPFVLLALFTLPALVYAFVVSLTGVVPVEFDQYVFSFQPLVMIFVATQAPVLVARDLRFRVMPLYFSRPLTRGDYLAAKVLAMTSAILLFFAVPLSIQLFGTLLAEKPLVDQLQGYATALVGAVLYAVLLASIGLLVASLAPRRGLGVAAIVTVLLVLSGVFLTLYGIGEASSNEAFEQWSILASPFTLVAAVMAGLFDTFSPLDERPDAAMAVAYVASYLAITGALLALLRVRYGRVPVS